MQNKIKNLAGAAGLLLSLAAVGASAQEMGSRVQGGMTASKQSLRSVTAPVMSVSISPDRQQLLEAAQSEAFREGIPPLAKALGIVPPRSPSAPRRVGSVFPSNAEARVVQWETQSDGSYVTHLRISSTGALGIRAKLQLPAGVTLGEMRVVARHGDIAERLPFYAAQQGEIWTPYTDGGVQIIELQTPQRVAGGQLKVLDIVHFEESLNSLKTPGEAGTNTVAGACSPDVVCTSNSADIDAAIIERRRSVARMNFQSGSGSFLCTGTLINSPSQQNFFLTANHCISTQAEASSLQTRWFYESTVCGNGVASLSPESTTVSGGAQLIFTNQFVDSTLLRLNLSPPAGAVFAGWNAAPLSPNTSAVSISHPTGDVMKFATGTLSSLQNRNDGLIRVGGYEQEMYAILFNRGVIEGGSSGSGLFVMSNGSLQLRGVLSNSTVRNAAGGMSCTNTNENANYGRWDYFYPQIAPLLNATSYPADDFPNQPAANATPITLGATVSGTLNYIGDIDVFRIQITQAGTLFARSAGGFDLIGNLMDANGNTLETNDDNFVGNNEFAITWDVTPGTYYLAVAPWNPTALTTTGYSVSTAFTTATTNYTSLWWGGDAESGWGVNLNHQGNVTFATMFNYEAAGQGVQNPNMWLSSVGNRVGTANSFSGDLLRVTGGAAFNAVPFTPITAANVVRVGNMRFDFSGPNNGTLTYDVAGGGTGGTGTTITKAITRQTFGTQPVCVMSGADRSFISNYQDLWWNPNESGWGINFTHQGDTIFATLFTYEPGAGALNKSLWLTATMPKLAGQQTFQGDLIRATGSAFNAVPFTPLNPAINATRVGNMRVQFTNGNAGQLTYDVNGQSVTKTIERQVFDAFRPECEAP
jgi:lysyl endopeptidase